MRGGLNRGPLKIPTYDIVSCGNVSQTSFRTDSIEARYLCGQESVSHSSRIDLNGVWKEQHFVCEGLFVNGL